MASREVIFTNEMLIEMAKRMLGSIGAESIEHVSIKGECLDDGRIKNTFTIIGIDGEMDRQDTEIKTGTKMILEL